MPRRADWESVVSPTLRAIVVPNRLLGGKNRSAVGYKIQSWNFDRAAVRTESSANLMGL